MIPKTDGGKAIKAAYGGQVASFVAATTYDNVEHTLLTLDRLNYDSLSLVINSLVTLTADKTLKTTCVVQDCATAQGSYANYLTIATNLVLATGALTADKSATKIDCNLAGAERYIKVLMSLDLEHSGSDTAAIYAGYILSGATTLPTT